MQKNLSMHEGCPKNWKKRNKFWKNFDFFFHKTNSWYHIWIVPKFGVPQRPKPKWGGLSAPPRYKVGLKSYWQWHLSFFPIKVSWLVTQLYMLRYLFSITNTAVNIPCLRWVCKIIQKISNISCIIYVSSLYFATRSFFSLRKTLKKLYFFNLMTST